MRQDRDGNTAIGSPWHRGSRKLWALVAYVGAKPKSLFNSLKILGALASGPYRSVELASLAAHLAGSVQGLRAIEAGRDVIEFNRLAVKILGEDADVFKFVDLPMSHDAYIEYASEVSADALAFASYGPHLRPDLLNRTRRVDDRKIMSKVLASLAGAMDSIDDPTFQQAASLAHQARRGVAHSTMARLLADVVQRE
eukprot:766901-Amphidinium_carterae.1